MAAWHPLELTEQKVVQPLSGGLLVDGFLAGARLDGFLRGIQ
jgi:hypothetical protein